MKASSQTRAGTWHEELKQPPKVANSILDWRAREAQAPSCAQCACSARGCRRRTRKRRRDCMHLVQDNLRASSTLSQLIASVENLIHTHPVPHKGGKRGDIAPQELVRRDNEPSAITHVRKTCQA